MSNRICEILGIEKPVIQGPMVWLTDARLVAAVSNAGGMGSLGPNAGQTVVTRDPEGTAHLGCQIRPSSFSVSARSSICGQTRLFAGIWLRA